MNITQIITLLQLALSLLVSASHASLDQQKQALAIATNAVQVAQVYLKSQVMTPVAVRPPTEPILLATTTDWYHQKWATGESAYQYIPKKIIAPLVYLEGKIYKSDGQIIKIKGRNRDSVLKELGQQGEAIPEINPYFAPSAYTTSSISKNEKIEISVVMNNPDNQTPNWNCIKTTGKYWTGKVTPLTDHMETVSIVDPQYAGLVDDVKYGPSMGGIQYAEIGFGVKCTATSTNTWYQEVKSDYFDLMTVDFVH